MIIRGPGIRHYYFKAPVLIWSNSTNFSGGLQSSAADCGGLHSSAVGCGGLESSAEIGRITPDENGSLEIIMSCMYKHERMCSLEVFNSVNAGL